MVDNIIILSMERQKPECNVMLGYNRILKVLLKKENAVKTPQSTG